MVLVRLLDPLHGVTKLKDACFSFLAVAYVGIVHCPSQVALRVMFWRNVPAGVSTLGGKVNWGVGIGGWTIP